MRGWLYTGLGFILGLILGGFVTTVLYLYTGGNDIVLLVQIPVIIGITVCGSKGFPIGGFRLPGITGNE